MILGCPWLHFLGVVLIMVHTHAYVPDIVKASCDTLEEPASIGDAMMSEDLLKRYNYDEFVPHKFEPWMRFDQSPTLGEPGPDFPLWNLEEQQTSLKQLLGENVYTIVEFGSFT